jgi:hypothetical protein
MERLSDGGESIHTQVSAREFGASPLQGRVLDFAGGHEHVTSLSEAEPVLSTTYSRCKWYDQSTQT